MDVTVYNSNKDMATSKMMDKHVAIFERIKMFFNKNVSLNYCNSEIADIYRGDKVAVHFWSSPVVAEMILPDVDKAFGITYCADGVYVPTEGYLTFGDDIPLIQYKDNNFYFLYDVCEYGTDEEYALIELLLNGIMVQLEGSMELVETKIQHFYVLEQEKKTKAFIERILAKERGNKQERERQLIKAKQDMENARKLIRSAVLNIKMQEDMLNTNGDSIAKLQDMLNKELAVMRSNKNIKKIDINDNGDILIYTNTIYSNVKGRDNVIRRYRFGEYLVQVGASTGTVKFTNMNKEDMRKSYWNSGRSEAPHPHISENGNACLGNASTLIMDCVDRYQWGVLADVLINYLESVNIEDSAGKHYWKWEQVDADGKRLPKQYNPEN